MDLESNTTKLTSKLISHISCVSREKQDILLQLSLKPNDCWLLLRCQIEWYFIIIWEEGGNEREGGGLLLVSTTDSNSLLSIQLFTCQWSSRQLQVLRDTQYKRIILN